MLETESTRSKPETTPTYIQWYETSDTLESAGVLCSRSSPTPVISISKGGILANWDLKSSYWKVTWEKDGDTFRSNFQLIHQEGFENPLLIQIPILDFESQRHWLVNQGRQFSLTRSLDQRVGHLLRFVKEHSVLVPEGTLFLVTRPGIQEAVERNQACRLILGYSTVEPEFRIPVQPMASWAPQVRLPSWLSVAQPPEPIRVSRYARPWLI